MFVLDRVVWCLTLVFVMLELTVRRDGQSVATVRINDDQTGSNTERNYAVTMALPGLADTETRIIRVPIRAGWLDLTLMAIESLEEEQHHEG